MRSMESVSSENTIASTSPHRDEDEDDGSISFQPQNPYPREESEAERRRIHNRKKSCKSNCINGNLVALKALLFIFYGGIGTIATWLNHTQISLRFSEKESLLIYGLSSLFSLATPIIFGLFSDKTAQPKKVLAICLLLAGLIYPLLLAVPPSEPYQYQDRLKWCKDTLAKDKALENSTEKAAVLGNALTSSSCLPNRLTCSSSTAELITDRGGCSEGCKTKVIISKCQFVCDGGDSSEGTQKGGNGSDSTTEDSSPVEYPDTPFAQQQKSDPDYDAYDSDQADSRPSFTAPPHLCVQKNENTKHQNLCYAFDKAMHEISLHASDITGHIDHDGKCHYPLVGYSEDGEEESLLSCYPISPHCQVSCDIRWDAEESDQWSCYSDFVNWIISFVSFVAIHTLGTMLVISAAGLLNSAILSMSHEHSGYFGCQYTYATLGFAIVPPAAAFLFEYIEPMDIPWNLQYLLAYSVWLLASSMLVICLPYHAEWVPKPKTVGPMLRRWSCRGHTVMFFIMIAFLGCFQMFNDVLSFHQIKFVGGNLLVIALGATAAVLPALIFVYRVEKVIDYCGHQNIFAIALVVLSLQFTGYAYLRDTEPEWSFLLKAMETFSVLMVWITASYTTYSAAPRSLAATCQTVIVTLYLSIGRGIGGITGFIGLTFLPKDLFLKIISLLAVFICALYMFMHYCCLKPSPYTRQYNYDRPATYAPSGRYTPLKLINGKKNKNLAKEDEALDDKDVIGDD